MLTLDAGRYRINIKAIKANTKDKTEEERYKFIGMLAVITGVPIIIICFYMLEIYGPNDKISEFILLLKKFYTVGNVENIRSKDNEVPHRG